MVNGGGSEGSGGSKVAVGQLGWQFILVEVGIGSWQLAVGSWDVEVDVTH